jgi:lipoate-protein ligase A
VLFADLTCLLDPEPHDAALNMAIDEALLRTMTGPLLRIYGWERPAASFGYFGKWTEVANAWPDRDLVRRWTGGGIVPHGEDVTYTLIVPRAHPFFARSPLETYRAIHEQVAAAIGDAALALVAAPRVSAACFENPAQHDVLLDGQKVAGAAQRRTAFGLLHQGSVQLAVDRPDLFPALTEALGSRITEMSLPVEVLALATRLAAERYGTDAWTRRF